MYGWFLTGKESLYYVCFSFRRFRWFLWKFWIQRTDTSSAFATQPSVVNLIKVAKGNYPSLLRSNFEVFCAANLRLWLQRLEFDLGRTVCSRCRSVSRPCMCSTLNFIKFKHIPSQKQTRQRSPTVQYPKAPPKPQTHQQSKSQNLINPPPQLKIQ